MCVATMMLAVLSPAPAAKNQAKDSNDKQLEADLKKTVQPFLKEFCASCHSGGKKSGGFSIDKYKNLEAFAKDQGAWDLAARHVRTKHMPPLGKKMPTDLQRTQFVAFVERLISAYCELSDAGKVTIRRLNREEYNNTVRDLLGVDLRPADDFPSDDVGYGFDSIGDVLTISPLLMEKYLAAAEKLATTAIRVNDPRTITFDFGKLGIPDGSSLMEDGGVNLFTRATQIIRHDNRGAGSYRLKIRAYGQQAGPEPCVMRVDHNGRPLQQFTVRQVAEKPGEFEVPLELTDGQQVFSLTFLNDYYNANDPDQKNRDRNLIIQSVELVGPFASNTPPPPSHTKIISITPGTIPEDQAARTVIGNFATRAYRRPATTTEVERLMQIFKKVRSQGDRYERAIQVCVVAVLVSPNFLFRVELDQTPKAGQLNEPVGDYELASRLSYFLWSSMPDKPLFDLAKAGRLKDPAVLSAQVDRMLADPKASALADNFAAQWLQLRKLETLSPDPKIFNGYSESLRKAMITETKLFFQSVVNENRPITDFLNADYTFVNAELAKHYGIPAPAGKGFSRVSLAGSNRGGLVTQASVLTVTSNPNRTSPVKRGKWVLEEILGAPPPPPPPDVGVLPDDAVAIAEKSVRERLEHHRRDPACATCHRSMDAIGFSLENFDGVGVWRTMDGKYPVDNKGELPDGTVFRGATELKQLLMKRQGDFLRCLSEKLLIYAVGRGLRTADNCIIDEITAKTTKEQLKMKSLIKAVVMSDAFRLRVANGGQP